MIYIRNTVKNAAIIMVVVLATFTGKLGYLGSREEVVHEFRYKGAPAQIIRTHLPFSADNYHIKIGKDRLLGKITADNGDIIETKHALFDSSKLPEGKYTLEKRTDN